MPTPMRYPWGKGTPKWTLDATANDSDKTFTVPTGKIWVLKSVKAVLVDTATVGGRSMVIQLLNGTPAEIQRCQPVAGTANQTVIVYLTCGGSFAYQAIALFSANAGTETSLGEVILPAGYAIRVYDANAVDAAADDLTVTIHYIEYDA